MASSSTLFLSETRAPAIYGTVATEIILSITFVALRLQARRLSFGSLRLDLSDWFIISALLFSLPYLIVVAVATVFGLGRHVEAVSNLSGLHTLSLLSTIFNLLALASLKLSILALYRSIFPSPRFHRAVTALAVLVVGWAAATLILGFAYNTPIEIRRDDSIPDAAQLVVVLAHIVIEILILLLPIPPVLRLQVSVEKKRLIILTFVVGGAGCIVSIARILVWILSESSADVSWQLVPLALLASTELTVGLLAVSFPVYRPLHKKPTYANKSNRQLVEIVDRPGACHDEFSRPQHEVAVSAVQDIPAHHIGIMVTDEIELMRRPKIDGGWTKVPDEEEPRS
ncbi:hypothetical protein F5Y10DRAFT_288254 [Nemania abortiva]|nr:hypothetical protein F5Y10DRAFT_288254 [Nemania abortiva]